MRLRLFSIPALVALVVGVTALSSATAETVAPTFTLLSDYNTGLGLAAAETVAYHQNRIFVTNSANNSLDIVDIANPASPQLVRRVPLASYGAGPNSVDVYRGMIMALCKLICRSDDDPTVIDRRLAASHAHMLEARQILAAAVGDR